MLWYTTFFYKYYKWLSSQYIYLVYFFNKLFIFIDIIFSKLQWLSFYSTNLYLVQKNKVKSLITRHRYHKPLTSYLINIGSNFSLINIYYSTTLETFQELNKSQIADNGRSFYLKNVKRLHKKLLNSFYI